MENKQLTCGIIMPISAMDGYSEKHWEEIKSIYEDVGKHCGFTRVQLVSEDTASNVIPTTIIKNIFENDIVICDVSGKNPNVMFELGIRIAFDKPVVITKDDKTKISFDIASLKYLGYPQSQHYGQMQTFKETLAKSLQATLKESPSYLQSFGINYSRVDNDEAFLKKLDNIEKDVRMTKVLTLQNRQKLQSEYGTSLSDVIMGIAQNTK